MASNKDEITPVPRILIADDSEDIREMMEKFICVNSPYACELAEDGRIAVIKYESARERGTPFHLLILDAAMPQLTGFEVTEYVRRQHDQVPIIIITGHAEPLTRAHADFVDADAVLPKPFDPAVLKELLGLASLPRRPGERVAAKILEAMMMAHA